ncbi:MAG: penicillin-binding protein 2 [Actinobacteria bacterium]|nr:penicillin-binding protein 2 [Actinomycetota bacterium]
MVAAADRRVRFRALGLVCIGVFAALIARMWYLQVLNAPTYEHVATLTSTRTISIPAPRGRILDRKGRVLVDNVPTKVVAIDRQRLSDASDSDAVISRLAALLNHYEHPSKPFTSAGIRRTLRVNQVGPFDPVPLAENVSDQLLVDLVEHQADYPGVVAETRLLRQYHYGTLAAQVLGRVGPIPEAEWKANEHSKKPYAKDAQVGLSGVEQSMEKYLRGTDGERTVEVTPAGRVVRTIRTVAATPGDDVELTLDIDAQATTEKSLVAQVEATRSSRGYPPVPGAAALMLDPRNGQVLSMASYPTFDPASFVPTISEANWEALQQPDAHAPLTNRADAGLYSPGSTFKLVTATSGLEHGIITPGSIYMDNGYVKLTGCGGGGCYFTNDVGDGALGPIALPEAITKSSNVFFFNIGERLWENRGQVGDDALQQTANSYGFGLMSGIDLSDEKAVPVPTPERRAKQHRDNPKAFPDGGWYTGSNLNLAIGQGDLLVTPLQLASAYGQFAAGGDRYRPTLLLRVVKAFAPLSADGTPKNASDLIVQPAPVKTGHVDLQPDWRAAMLQGFTGVTQSSGGTAADTFTGFPFDRFSIAGKTGTAQLTGNKFSNAFFVGFGPTSDPGYVGVAVLEQAGYGASAAAPVVRSMFEPIATDGGWTTAQPTIPSAPTGGGSPRPGSTTTLPAADGAANGAGSTSDSSTTSTSTSIAGAGGR